MKFILETNRLILREFRPTDSKNLYDLNSDPEVIRYTGDPPFQSVEDAEQFLINYSDYKRNGYGRWAVISMESDKFLGWCGLKLNELGLVDLGFRFFRDEWGKGFATESARASLEYGFEYLDIEEIIGRAALENMASIKVLEKLQMNYWKQDTCKGIENSVYYRINKSQYSRLKPFTSSRN